MKRKLTAFALALLCAAPVLLAQSRAELLEKAKAGEAEAQFKLGFCYQYGKLSYNGDIGETSRDYDAAEKWYRRAAAQDYMPAFFSMGQLYLYDRNDRGEAVRWYKKCADCWYKKYGKREKQALEKLRELGVDYDPAAHTASAPAAPALRRAPDFTAPASTQSARAESSPQFDLTRDEKIVNRYMAQSNSHAAMDYLNKLFANDQYPDDADVMFGYATLLQRLLVQIRKEGAAAVSSLNLMSAMTTTVDEQSANNKMISLLFLAANKGHRGAYRLLQLKVAQNGGNASFQPSPSGSSKSVVGRKTCSLCHGRGWIPGSKTATYGNGGTYWCSECQSEVTASHSHDRCPSCGGRGTVPTLH